MATLDEKVVLITGTGGGQGRVASLIFAREGAKIIGCDIQADANNETVELVRRSGGEMTGIAPIDLTDPEQARRLVEDAVAVYDGLDVVYNNAAMQRFGERIRSRLVECTDPAKDRTPGVLRPGSVRSTTTSHILDVLCPSPSRGVRRGSAKVAG